MAVKNSCKFEWMKITCKTILAFFLFSVMFCSCRKNSFVTSSKAYISISADTLHFDTVFTSTGSVTQSFKIFNLNDEKLHLNKIELTGGASSPFKINVNGVSRNSLSDIDIAANDSIYVFVTVNIDPNQLNIPFIVKDSILINYNSNKSFVQLEAYGRNAHFLKNFNVTHDTIFTSDLPFVILGSLTVKPSAILTIENGAQIFCHQDAAIIIEGSLKVNGEKAAGSQVVFNSDRLDDPYKYYPGSWPGIIFSESSTNNEINSAIIKNATAAITVTGKGNYSLLQLKLNACIITNNLNEGIKAVNSNIYVENCLITNCGLNNINLNGGNYNFVFCTIASYSDALISHAAPVLAIADTISATQTAAVKANFTNCILYGENGSFDDEINFFQPANNVSVQFDHVLYKAQNLTASVFNNSINNSDPGFINIDIEDKIFDFHLTPQSVCKNAGKVLPIKTDLEGNPRSINSVPDIGCYEIQ
jgi:hypothetical protein